MNNKIYHFLFLITIISFVNCSTQKGQHQKEYFENIYEKESNSDIVYYYIDTIAHPNGSISIDNRAIVESVKWGKDRKIVQRNWRALFSNRRINVKSGKIATMICVNRDGVVTYAETIPKETSVTDPFSLKKAVNAAKGYRVEADQNAPDEECGKLIFDLDINARIK